MTATYGVVIWVLCSLMFREILWTQFACFALTTYILVELNNSNALLRTFSRMVSCSYIVMACMVCFMFLSLRTGITGLCIVAAYTTMFNSYQDRKAMGWIFYTFMLLSIASLINVHILYYVPIFWIVLYLFLISLNIRTFFASILGILAPYWFVMVYFIYTNNLETPMQHFTALTSFGRIADFNVLNINQIISLAFILVMAITGSIHFIRNNANDKIRIRMLYYCFICIDLMTVIFAILQPQHYDLLLTMMIITTSPLIAHYIALTHTKLTNYSFIMIAAGALTITVFNIFSMIGL